MSTRIALFGTDGVRGPANGDRINVEIAQRLGRAAVECFKGESSGRPTIVIGKDTRVSGDMLEAALAAGAASMGADVWLAGEIPTPGVAFLTRALGAAAGVVVSASHNPFADNGIKFFGPDGFKLPDEVEAKIEEAIAGESTPSTRPVGEAIGRIRALPDAIERYAASLQGVIGAGASLRPLRMVLDCANGAAHRVGPLVFAGLGVEVSTLGISPNGTNINAGIGAVHPQALQKAVVDAGANLGLALDGDADRAIFVDEMGDVVDGDEILAMLGREMHAQGQLAGSTVVATVMSNLGLELSLREVGIRLNRTQVGDRYVVEEMRRGGFALGGEPSGHLLFLESSTTGDGIVAGIHVARMILAKNEPLSRLRRVMTRLPQITVNVRVTDRRELDSLPDVQHVLAQVAGELGDRGRVLVRYSGTEPLVRVMVEGVDDSTVRIHADRIAEAIRRAIGAKA